MAVRHGTFLKDAWAKEPGLVPPFISLALPSCCPHSALPQARHPDQPAHPPATLPSTPPRDGDVPSHPPDPKAQAWRGWRKCAHLCGPEGAPVPVAPSKKVQTE
uniref:Uncharacterized protein n=1 Tax=Sus scrofa TaxID=9823 RepID=A0A8D0N206_PIG